MPMWVMYLHNRVQIIMGKHISDTTTVCWEIYCIHPSLAIRCFQVRYARHQLVAWCFASLEISRQTYIDTQIDCNRITESNGYLAVPTTKIDLP